MGESFLQAVNRQGGKAKNLALIHILIHRVRAGNMRLFTLFTLYSIGIQSCCTHIPTRFVTQDAAISLAHLATHNEATGWIHICLERDGRVLFRNFARSEPFLSHLLVARSV